MASDRTIAGIGRVVLALGAILIFVSGALAGAFANGGAGGQEGNGYDVARAALFPAVLWVIAGLALWRVGRLKLFGLCLAVAIAGYALAAFTLGDLDAGGSADSMADVGLVIGGIGSFVGLLMAGAGARLARLSALRHQSWR